MSSRKKKLFCFSKNHPHCAVLIYCGSKRVLNKNAAGHFYPSVGASWQAAGANHKSCIGYKSKTADTLTLWVIYLKYNSQNQKSKYVPW